MRMAPLPGSGPVTDSSGERTPALAPATPGLQPAHRSWAQAGTAPCGTQGEWGALCPKVCPGPAHTSRMCSDPNATGLWGWPRSPALPRGPTAKVVRLTGAHSHQTCTGWSSWTLGWSWAPAPRKGSWEQSHTGYAGLRCPSQGKHPNTSRGEETQLRLDPRAPFSCPQPSLRPRAGLLPPQVPRPPPPLCPRVTSLLWG